MSDEPRVKIAGVEYEIPKLTLGEQRDVKRISGMAWADVPAALASADPDAIVGFLYAVFHRQYPGRSEESLVAEIEALDEDAFEDLDEAADAVPPADGDTGSPSPVTIPDPSGNQHSGLSAISHLPT